MKRDLLRLLGLFRPYTRWIIAGTLLTILVDLANIGLLALSGWFITAMALVGLGGGLMNYFTPAAGIRGLAILRTGGRYIERLVTHEATFRLLARLRVWFYEHLEPLAPARLQYYRGGDLLSRIRSDIDTLDNFYLRVLAPTVAAAVSLILLVGFMTLFSGSVALIDLAGLLVAGVALPLLAQRLGQEPGRRAVAVRADLRSSVADGVHGLGELRVYRAAHAQAQTIERLSHDLIEPQRRQARINGISAGLTGLAAQLTVWLAVLVAIPLVRESDLDGPELAMIALFVMASFGAVSALPLAFQTLGETLAAARRIFEIIDTKPVVEEPAQEAATPGRFGLRLEGLRMRYGEGAPWALDGIDLEVAAGRRVGIVGATGSGKTSLLNVLLRFWDYQEGEIRIGGVPLRKLRGETVRGWCAVVAQQTHLFNTSVRQNLLLARPDASEDALAKALQQANVYDEIRSLPEGLDTIVGETGTRLSGGQARRVAIARALLRDAPILLLDEPTEGLDAAAEHAVLQALEALMRDRTTLLITHRPQALRYVDEVLVLSHGRIIEQGSAEALMREGRYLPAYAGPT
jgi:ATP-binding cassette, subfamily C, bacterial CydC